MRITPWRRALRVIGLVLLLDGCATAPPSTTKNLCQIFDEKSDWYEATLQTQKKWGVPIAVQMAILRHESAFVADARPPREWFLGFIPLGRPSTAYGYSQALDGTWEQYQQRADQDGADRDEFEDAVDFVGWYTRQSSRELGISGTDAYRQYLAYHEGQGGVRKGTYRQKPWLMGVAKQVANTAKQYDRQLNGCRPEAFEFEALETD